jgi:predicted component of type VI protein secretion system
VQARWRELQASFVDDPGESVQRADGLVSEVVESLTSTLTSRTNALRDRWKSAESADTEELRQALRDYRSVLEHLLALSSKSPHQFQNDGSR